MQTAPAHTHTHAQLLSTHPPAASNLKAAPQLESGALAVAGCAGCGWSAGAQIGALLTRLFPACHCQCLVSLRARPFRLRVRVRFRCAHLLFCSSRASAARLHVAAARVVRCACRLLPRRGARWVGCLEAPPTRTHIRTLVLSACVP
jgi:hypothetical protein